MHPVLSITKFAVCRTFFGSLRLTGGCGARRLTFGIGRSLIFWNSATGTALSMTRVLRHLRRINKEAKQKTPKITKCKSNYARCAKQCGSTRSSPRSALIVALTRAGARHRLTDTHSKHKTRRATAKATVATAMQHLLDASARGLSQSCNRNCDSVGSVSQSGSLPIGW